MKNMPFRHVILSGVLTVLLCGASTAMAAPRLSLSISPAGPGGVATAMVSLTDASDIESFALALDFTGGTALTLPATGWFTRGDYVPATPFGPAPPVELNKVFESTARTKVFFDGFKPTGTSGTVGSINFQVNPSASIGSTHNVALTGQYLSASTQQVSNIPPTTLSFTVASVPSYILTAILTGTGSGSVHSIPAGISCDTGTCAANFNANSQVNLMKTSSSDSVFEGWSGGGCSGTGDCTVTMTADKTITATFTSVPPVRLFTVIPAYYTFLQAAFNAATTSVTVQARATTLTENLKIDKAYQYILKGGYNADFNSRSGNTTLKGIVTIRKGKLVVDRLRIK